VKVLLLIGVFSLLGGGCSVMSRYGVHRKVLCSYDRYGGLKCDGELPEWEGSISDLDCRGEDRYDYACM